MSLALCLSMGMTLMSDRARAASPETAPPELKQTLSQIETAANRKDLQGVLQHYSPNFNHGDGLNRQTLERSLTGLWQQYPDLTYRTELQAWQPTENGLQADTVTVITGTQAINGQKFQLKATLKSRQQFANQKLVQQTTLSERNQITSGEKPPLVQVNAPEEVQVDQEFNFDAIVQEPLGQELLLGCVSEEFVNSSSALNAAKVNLEPLAAGGVFKVGRATKLPSSQWISAVLVKHGGITMITHRVRVVPGNSK
jgi:hypothetical protein